jgi:hypothetical protein
MKTFGGKREGARPASEVGGGATTQSDSDFVVQFCDAVNSTISPRTGAVQLSLTGIAGLDYEASTIPLADDTKAQSMQNAEQYSAPGIIGRPLPPENLRGVDYRMNMLCMVTADGLVPFAYRDLRWKMGGNGPGPGTLAFVGYGGGFHSLVPVSAVNGQTGKTELARGGTIHILYCPYDYDSNGSAQKAHTIILDPTDGNESIVIAHANGLAITMADDAKKSLVMKNASGNATLRLDDDGITMTAAQITLAGTVTIGEPLTALPIAAGPAVLPSSKLRYSSP